jgi:hypothetical protein
MGSHDEKEGSLKGASIKRLDVIKPYQKKQLGARKPESVFGLWVSVP